MSSYLTFDPDNTKAEITLFGGLGVEVDGHSLAEAISYAGEEVGEITLLINSNGGSISHGLSVVAAIQHTSARVEGKVVGIAASMAAIIAMACDKTSVVDFGRIMIHDPSFSGSQRMNKKALRAIEATASQISQIICAKSGMSDQKARKAMKEETWYTAQEALQEGLVDEVVTTKKKEAFLEASVDEIYNQATQHTPDMSKIIQLAALAAMFDGITNEATPEEATAFLEGLKNDLAAKDTTIANLKSQLSGALKKDDADALKNKVKELETFKAEQLVNKAIEMGKIDASKKEDMVNTAKADLEGFENLLSGIPAKSQNITSQLKPGQGESRKDWTFDDWQKKDPKGLENLQKESPEEFERLVNEYLDPAYRIEA